jgi:hypothetical protein
MKIALLALTLTTASLAQTPKPTTPCATHGYDQTYSTPDGLLASRRAVPEMTTEQRAKASAGDLAIELTPTKRAAASATSVKAMDTDIAQTQAQAAELKAKLLAETARLTAILNSGQTRSISTVRIDMEFQQWYMANDKLSTLLPCRAYLVSQGK